MNRSVYESKDYKTFVIEQIDARPGGGRGVRRQLAQAVGCQPAYVSHVLAGDRHFSPEQAERAASFLGLGEDEREFFFLLVEHAKAGTVTLRRMLARQLESRRDQFRQVKTRIRAKEALTIEDQATYYSSWHFQAVRMLLMIPGQRTPIAISERLKIPLARVREILSFLIERGLARMEGEEYVTTRQHVHVSLDSPLLSKLHSNWRVHALQSLDRKVPEELHYSSVCALSRDDAQKIREILLRSITATHEVVGPSREECLFVINLDWYEL